MEDGNATPGEYPFYPTILSHRQIRILRLEPGTGTEDLVCHVRIVSLDDDDKPPYEAVSYVWGDPEPAQSILFNGLTGKTITPNLADALRNFRLPDLGLDLWVDALCIDQDDLDERAQQIQLMGDVYSQARNTLIWLGLDRDDTSDGVDIFRLARAQFYLDFVPDGDEDHADLTGESVPFDEVKNEQRGFPHSSDGKWDAARNILTREWFDRVWVVQEFGLGKNPYFIIGKLQIAAMDLALAAIWFTRRGYGPLINWIAITRLYAMVLCMPSQGVKKSLSKLLDEARSLNATDLRDKVFGLLALSREGSEQPLCTLLVPNYRKPLARVFLDTTRHFLRCAPASPYLPNLDILSSINYTSEYSPQSGLPSWVPRWDERSISRSSLEEDQCASGTLLPHFGGPWSDTELVLRGFKLSTVSHRVEGLYNLYHPTAEPWEDRTIWKAVKDMWMRHARTLVRPPNSTDLAFVFAQTLSRGGMKEKLPGRPTAADFAVYCRENLAEDARESNLREDGDSVDGAPPDHDPAFEMPVVDPVSLANGDADRMRFGISKNMIFTADNGHMGAGPESMRAGDVVCILFGGRTPYILRPEDGHHTLVGGCYIHGLMHGEALVEKEVRGLDEEWFTLR